MCVCVLVAHLYLTLCDLMDYSPPESSVCGIPQVRILEWVAMSSSRGLPHPGIESMSLTSPALVGRFFTTEPPGKLILKGITTENY